MPVISRRLVLTGATSLALVRPALAQPTPACDGRITIRQTEGPYFKPLSPLRTSLLEPGMAGDRQIGRAHV